MASPPRLAEWLLSRLLRAGAWRETTLGDLREEFAAMSDRRDVRSARRWYWRETVTLLASRPAPTRPSRPRKDPLMRTLLAEARLAARALWRQPTVSLAIIATLSIGLGLNAATFGMMDALLLRPFAIPNIERLVVLSELSASAPYPKDSVAPGNYLDLKRHIGGAITRMSTVSWWDVNLSGGDRPERLRGSQVGADFFTMLGLTPAQGRFFHVQDEAIGAPRTVVISDALWHRNFAAAPDAIGRTVQLDGESYTIIGRAPAAFDFPSGSDLWTPLVLTEEERTGRTARWLTVIGELRPGATSAQAQAEMTAAYTRLKEAHEAENGAYSLVVQSFEAAMVDYGLPRVIGLWQASALLLLLIAGTNVANLFLARGAERQREIAVRLAIGASRWRMIRQLLIESVVLAVVAIPAALLIAWGAIAAIRTLMPADLLRFLPGWMLMGVNPRVALATAAVALTSAIVFGLLPALRVSRPSLASALKDGGRSSTGGLGRSRLRRGLVVAQVALALPLLLCAGLAALGGHRMAAGPQGYDPDGLVRVRMSLPTATYADDDARRTFTTRLLAEASSAPEMLDVATASIAPATAGNQRRRLVVDGRDPDPDGPRWINYRAVSDSFHRVLGIPIMEGRAFTASDRDGTEPVAVISDSLARLYWPDASPVGRRVKLSPTATEWVTIVGTSGNVLDDWFNSRNAPTIYVPVRQFPSTEIHLLARGRSDASTQLATLRAAVQRVDRTLPVYDVQTMRAAIHTRTTGLRLISQFMAVFGLVALFLASAGIYGVMAHYVAQRRHEIGVRMALGATARSVLQLTVGQGLRLAVAGIVIGIALGVALAQVMESALFGVVSLDLSLFIGGPIVLALVALVAIVVPARAALRVDPASVLRQ
jgi:putative ABC transport system permease protein